MNANLELPDARQNTPVFSAWRYREESRLEVIKMPRDAEWLSGRCVSARWRAGIGNCRRNAAPVGDAQQIWI